MILDTPNVTVPAHQADALGARGQHEAACDLERTLRGNGAADVARIALAEGVFNVLADGVQLESQIVDVGIGQVRECRNVGNSHRSVSFLLSYATVTYDTVGYQ